MAKKHLKSAMNQIVKELVAERQRQGLSHEKLGDLTGLHRSTISLIEARKREATLLTLLKITEALDVDLGKLITSALQHDPQA